MGCRFPQCSKESTSEWSHTKQNQAIWPTTSKPDSTMDKVSGLSPLQRSNIRHDIKTRSDLEKARTQGRRKRVRGANSQTAGDTKKKNSLDSPFLALFRMERLFSFFSSSLLLLSILFHFLLFFAMFFLSPQIACFMPTTALCFLDAVALLRYVAGSGLTMKSFSCPRPLMKHVLAQMPKLCSSGKQMPDYWLVLDCHTQIR